jgi:hypothetical protein
VQSKATQIKCIKTKVLVRKCDGKRPFGRQRHGKRII